MSATTPTHVPAHDLVRRIDSRGRGMWHAAPPATQNWRTACGRVLAAVDDVFSGYAALAIASAPDAQVCAGCIRVGDAL